MSDTVLLIVFGALLLPGIAGAVMPVLPSTPYMFIVALIYGFVVGFSALTGTELAILAALALVSLLIDYLSGVLGAKYGGAAARSLGVGMLGLIMGLILFPPLGGIIGLFIGIFIAEYYRHNNQERAVRAATSGLIGSLVGIGINLLIAVAFFALFLYFVLR